MASMENSEEHTQSAVGTAVSPTAIDISTPASTTEGSQLSQEPASSKETVNPISSYQIKPNLENKFKARPIQEIIRNIVNSKLLGRKYNKDNVKGWITEIANSVNEEVKTLDLPRYKHIVQVILGEKAGQGVKSGIRCLWDAETDSYASEVFMNDTMYCVVTVFAIYFY